MAQSRTKRRVVVLAALLAVAGTAARSGAGYNPQPAGGDWSVRAVVIGDSIIKQGRGVLWLGITNKRPTATLVCFLTEGYGVSEAEVRSSRMLGSPHACGAEAAYHLLLGGETVFLAREISLEKAVTPAAEVWVEVSVVERDHNGVEKPASIQPSWRGTLSAAIEAGAQLRLRE